MGTQQWWGWRRRGVSIAWGGGKKNTQKQKENKTLGAKGPVQPKSVRVLWMCVYSLQMNGAPMWDKRPFYRIVSTHNPLLLFFPCVCLRADLTAEITSFYYLFPNEL